MVEFPYLLPPDRRWTQVRIWPRGEVVEQLMTTGHRRRAEDEIAVTQRTHTTLHATHAAPSPPAYEPRMKIARPMQCLYLRAMETMDARGARLQEPHQVPAGPPI
jgi:hypothetical protein